MTLMELSWVERNPEKAKEVRRAWKNRNAEKQRESNRASYRKHRAARLEACKRWRDNNPEKVKRYIKTSQLRRTYGLELEAFEAMKVEQSGKCAICRRVPEGERGFHVDHDHATGEVRSLLCGQCNVGLGSFDDSPALLRAAADYLERHAAEPIPFG